MPIIRELKDLDYYKAKVRQLSPKRYQNLIKKAGLQEHPENIQITMGAAFWRHQDQMQLLNEIDKTKILTINSLYNTNEFLFNDLCFVLWAMPQENPIPTNVYNKMMTLKKLNKDNLPILPSNEMTNDEKALWLDNLVWKRGNEDFGIEIIGSPISGIPFGQDRLLLIWVITQALKANQPQVIGFHMREFLNYFEIDTSGKSYDRLEERFDRLKESTVKVWWTKENKKFELKCNYLDTVAILRPKKRNSSSSEEMNVVTLSTSLWLHLAKQNFVFLNPKIVKQLKEHPGALDLYQWSCAYSLRQKSKTIPMEELARQLGMKTEQLTKHKKRSIKRWINLVNELVKKDTVSGNQLPFTLRLEEATQNHKFDRVTLEPNDQFLSIIKNIAH
jgi:Replication initiator protein A